VRVTINLNVEPLLSRRLAIVVPIAVALVAVGGIAAYVVEKNSAGGANLVSPPAPASEAVSMQAAQSAGGVRVGDQSAASGTLKTHESELLADTAFPSQGWSLLMVQKDVEMHTFPGAVSGFPGYARYTMHSATANPWDIQVAQPVSGRIVLGQHLRLSVWARSTDRLTMHAVCEQNGGAWTKLALCDFALTPQWHRYDLAWTADQSEAAGWAHVSLQLGGKPGDIAGAKLTSSTAVS
jgi:hypothetical protein